MNEKYITLNKEQMQQAEYLLYRAQQDTLFYPPAFTIDEELDENYNICIEGSILRDAKYDESCNEYTETCREESLSATVTDNDGKEYPLNPEQEEELRYSLI